jgi:hypothetical protein
MTRPGTHTPIVEYHPNGYESLGLVSRTLPLTYRRDANLKTLRTRLERWERRQGNTNFQARNLEKLPVELAFELVHVYVAMRERYPSVTPDHVDFLVRQDKDLLATAGSYMEYYPTLRRIANDYDLHEIPLDVTELQDSTEDGIAYIDVRDIKKELDTARSDRVGNVFATGVIEFGDTFARPRKYRELITYWQRRNEAAVEAGRPLRVPELATSAATFVFIHEFGHLVEAELMQRPYKDFERVYASLTEALLGHKPNPNQWRYHLVNYPAYAFTSVTGRHMGSKERQRETRRRLKQEIGEQLGSYAPSAREELFAEAFALSLVSKSAKQRQRLSLLQGALTRVDLRVARLPRRSRIA